MAGNGFIARVSGKNGKLLHKTSVHDTREKAASAAFEARPKATKCSSCKATPDGDESHNDIRWHDRPAEKKPVKETARVRPTLAKLLEDTLEKATTVAAAKDVSTKIGDMAEALSKLEANDLMPMGDALRTNFGPQVADHFTQVATQKIRELITAVQNSKNAIDNEVSRMQTIVDGGDSSDIAMGAEAEPPAPMGDELPSESDDMAAPEDMPADPALPPEADSSPDVGATGFAGRAKKESARHKGRQLNEENAADDSVFKDNFNKLAALSPKLYADAHDICDAIHNLPVSGDTRNALVKVLGHLVAMSESEDAWDDPEEVAESACSAHLDNAASTEIAKNPDVGQILKNTRKFAHKIALKHSGDLNEEEISPMDPTLPPPATPATAAPITPAATPVAASPLTPPAKPAGPLDAPPRAKPSILTAGRVYEGRQTKAIKMLRESPHPDRMILTVFRNVFKECADVAKAVQGTAKVFSIDVGDVVSIIREAKSNVKEDAVPSLMGVPMGQPDGGSQNPNPALMSQNPTKANPIPGKPNKPMTPADMRAQKFRQEQADKTAKANNQANKPITAPVPQVPTQQVKPVQPNMNAQKTSAAANKPKAPLPPMPGKVVNSTNIRMN
jgi:hypothetical protein